MRKMLIPIAALLLSDGLLLIGHGLLLTLLPVAALTAGFSDTEVAFTGSAYFVGFVTGCIFTPLVVRRVGHIRSFAVLATSYSAVVLLFPLIPTLLGWLLLRFLIGAAISGLYMIIESWLNERSSKENRSTVLSIYTTVNLLMIMVGQQLLNLGPADAKLLFALAAVIISIAIIPVSLTLSLAPAPLQNVKINVPKLWRESRISSIGAIVHGVVTGSFWALGPVYGKIAGYNNLELSLFMSATVLGGAVFQLPVGRLSDHFDRRSVLLVLTLVGAIVSALIALLPGVFDGLDKLVLVCLTFLWGGSVMTQYAICLAHANDRALPEDFVVIGSGMLLVLGVFSAIGAPLASLAMNWLGAAGLHLFMTGWLLLFALAIVLRRMTHHLKPLESPEPFRVVADMTTPAAYEMDPRTDEDQTADKPE